MADPTSRREPAPADAERALLQRGVDAYFDSRASYWRDVYAQDGLEGVVYRSRMEAVLAWVDEVGPEAGATALEVGCGAGMMTVELARRGLCVDGVDSSAAMVSLAARAVAAGGLGSRTTVQVADVHHLPFASGAFRVVVAVGLVPWLHSPDLAIAELARVLAPGGHLILTADNRARLNWLTEPRENPLLSTLRPALRAVKRRRGWRPSEHPSRLHMPRQVDRLLVGAGLEPALRRTVGFGPFSFRGRPLRLGRLGLRLHTLLQRSADRGGWPLRWLGWHYLVAARKPRTSA